jgi:hypothetical protein
MTDKEGGYLITTKDKIDILFKEYDTLRAEILNRTNNLFTLMAIGGGVLTLLLSFKNELRLWLPLLLFFGLIFGFIAWINDRNIRRIARRLMQIENQVNHLAGGDEPLLEWETRWGAAAFGISRFRKDPPAEKLLKE